MRRLPLLAAPLLLFGFLATTPAQKPVPKPPRPPAEASTLLEGMLIAWAGPLENLPRGWLLCDGSQGTPDLRDRFLLGAAPGKPVGKTGGANEVTLTSTQLPGHNHGVTFDPAGEHTHDLEDRYHDVANFYMFFGPTDSNASEPIKSKTKGVAPSGNHDHGGSLLAGPAAGPFDNRPASLRLAWLMKDRTPAKTYPVGAVLPFNGLVTEVPKGWDLCDGLAGRPDLMGRFAQGTAAGPPGDQEGADQVGLTAAELPPHSHGVWTSDSNGNHIHTFLDYYNPLKGGMTGGLIPIYDIPWSPGDHTGHTTEDGQHSHPGTVASTGLGHPLDSRPAFVELPFLVRTAPTGPALPERLVVPWCRPKAAFPLGWSECDGRGGRLDLRDRFLRGAFLPGGSGGSHEHTLTQDELPPHGHGLSLSSTGAHIHVYTEEYRATSVTMWTGGPDPRPYAFPPVIQNDHATHATPAHVHDAVTSGSSGGGQPFDNRPAFHRVVFLTRQ